MRLRSLLVLGTAALLLVSGCTPEPVPTPRPTASPSVSPTPTPTPTDEPIVAPETAFDVTCDDVATVMRDLLGEPTTPVEPVLSTVSTMSWIPGPGQHMFQRAGGIACSAGEQGDRAWEVVLVPGAATVIAGAAERGGYYGEQSRCENGYCVLEFPDGDVLLSATVHAPGLGTTDLGRVDEALRQLLATASASVRDVEYVDSEVVGAPCERFLTPEQVNERLGVSDASLFTDFGGWGIPAEVYEYVNGSRICLFRSSAGFDAPSYVMVTTLPAGAWAFEETEGAPASVDGADAAKSSVGEYGESILDVRVGVDWIRLTTYDDNGSGAADPTPLAAAVVRNLTVGQTAPQ